MGNCIRNSQSNERLSMKSSERTTKMKQSSPRKCQSDPLQEVSFKSNTPDNDEMVLKSYRPHCRIPILKERYSHDSSERNFRGYKSVLVNGPASSRIPVTSPNSDFRNSVSNLTHEDNVGHHKFTESGFVSDLSVTASTYSQPNGDVKASDAVGLDVPHVAVIRNHMLSNKQSSCSITNQSTDNTLSVTNNATMSESLPPEVVPMRSSTMITKQYHTRSVNGKVKRPQSLSTESEVLINKSLSKRVSDASDSMSPSVASHEHNTFMQDVSSLKLMLHKLKRYLTQDGDERLLDIDNIGLFRACPSPAIDIRAMTRDELEQRYEALLDQNGHLERLLQSREKVIAQLHGEKVCADCAGSVVTTRTHRLSERMQQSGLGDTRGGDRQPRSWQEQWQDEEADSAPYQWPHLKLPQTRQ